MSAASDQRSAEFLKIADQFKLGALVTESSHPVTANLSETAEHDLAAGLKELFKVDEDVLRKYREVAESGRIQQLADTVLAALKRGGNIYFTGCGSTGRLSIQLVSIWRDFWQQQGRPLTANRSADASSVLGGSTRLDGHIDLECSRAIDAAKAPGGRRSHSRLRDANREIPWGGKLSPFDEVRGTAEGWEQRAFAVMAGGDYALIKAVEGFEDYTAFGRRQIADLGVCGKDVVFAITEGGETSFVIGTAWQGVEVGAKVYFVYNNPDDILGAQVERSREVIRDARIEKVNLTTGPMAITGSTRMQATSIQLAVMVTVLELVARELSGHGNGAGVPGQFLAKFAELHAALKSSSVLSQLARLVELEESVYRAGRKNNYYADRVAIDMLTDTTERSPTYCTPPFRKFDDATATESWAFLHVPYPDSPSAWEHVCKRTPQCVEWSADVVRDLVPADKFARTVEIISRISHAELTRFRIGCDGIKNRPLGPGDSAVALVVEAERQSILAPDGFQRVQLEAAFTAGAKTGLIFAGGTESCREMEGFVAQWNPDCVTVLLPLPQTDLLLDGVMRVGLKMLLNALSTCTMVRLGRVMGNTMIWVVPSNLKLIDRATRYIARLANLDYAAANRLLFEVIEYVEPRMKADQAYPPVVGVAVLRARHRLSNEDAERRLKESVGNIEPEWIRMKSKIGN